MKTVYQIAQRSMPEAGAVIALRDCIFNLLSAGVDRPDKL